MAEKYRMVVVILADGSLGQMMEPAELPPMRPLRKSEDRPEWAITGAKDRDPQVITSIYIDPVEEEKINLKLMRKYREIEKNEVRYRMGDTDDADIVVVAFGTAGRIAQSAVKMARQEGIKVGLFRPISLYPYPYAEIREMIQDKKAILVVEMNGGQMLEDVKLAVQDRLPISFYGRMGGMVPLPDEIFDEIRKIQQNLDETK